MPMVKDYLKNNFKHGIEAGVLQYGVGQETTSAEVAEILATADIDWLFVDGEHGGHTVTTILDIARAIAAYDVTPVVRIPQAGTGIIKQLLDGGIQNIIIPKVETGEETEDIMYWASYAPRGNRGFGASAVRAGRFNRHPDYLDRNVEEICILPQIESVRGWENLEAIASTPGVGAIFLGPIDLAVDMGHGINIFHPEVEAAMDDMIKRVRKLGKPVGTIALTTDQAKRFVDLGVSFLALGGDTFFLTNAVDNLLKTYKDFLKV